MQHTVIWFEIIIFRILLFYSQLTFILLPVSIIRNICVTRITIRHVTRHNLPLPKLYSKRLLQRIPKIYADLLKLLAGLYINRFITSDFVVFFIVFSAECINSLTHDTTYLSRALKELQFEDAPSFLRALDISMVRPFTYRFQFLSNFLHSFPLL